MQACYCTYGAHRNYSMHIPYLGRIYDAQGFLLSVYVCGVRIQNLRYNPQRRPASCTYTNWSGSNLSSSAHLTPRG